MKIYLTAACLILTGWMVVPDAHCQRAFRINGQLDSVVDLDANDGFDFVQQYSEGFSLKFAITGETPELVSNEQVDGGSRTTYSGITLTDLSFADGSVDLVDMVVPGEFVYWDRVRFSQHVLELNFEIGQSTVSIVFTADQGNADGAFGQMFLPATPRPNTGELEPLEFSNGAEAKSLFTNPQIVIQGNANQFGGAGEYLGSMDFQNVEVLLGDVNLDDRISLLDVSPFIEAVLSGVYQEEADMNL